MTHTVVGLFDNRNEAQEAMQELIREGFIQEDIDLSNRTYSETMDDDGDTSSTGIGDSISNFFNSLFGDDRETASNYTNAAQDADAILTVLVDSEERARQAAEIFDRHGAIDVDERGAQYNRQQNYADTQTSQTAGTKQNYAATSQATDSTNTMENRTRLEEEKAIPVMEEQLQVGKREVERGGARVRIRIVEKPVEANVRLREEHVVVNRRPVNREVTNADMANLKEGEIELTERAEVPVVNKQARVVEEVEVGKEVQEREETVRDTIRRNEVDVEGIKGDATDDSTHTNTRRATP
jgi:uncharacterized protein (TIGR02271 family)